MFFDQSSKFALLFREAPSMSNPSPSFTADIILYEPFSITFLLSLNVTGIKINFLYFSSNTFELQ